MGDCCVCDEPLRQTSPLKRRNEEPEDEHEENIFATRCGHMYHFSCLHDYINTFKKYSGRVKVDCPICEKEDISQDFLLHVKIHDHDIVPYDSTRESSSGKLVSEKEKEFEQLTLRVNELNSEIDELEGVKRHLEKEKNQMTKNLSEIQISDEFLDNGHEVITILEEEFNSLQTTCRYLEEKKADLEIAKLKRFHKSLRQNSCCQLKEGNVKGRFKENRSRTSNLPRENEREFIYVDEVGQDGEIFISEIDDIVGPEVYGDDYQLCEVIDDLHEQFEGSEIESINSMKNEVYDSENESHLSQGEILKCLENSPRAQVHCEGFCDSSSYTEDRIVNVEDYGDDEDEEKGHLDSGKSLRLTTSKYTSMITPPEEFSDFLSSDEHDENTMPGDKISQVKVINYNLTGDLHKAVEKLSKSRARTGRGTLTHRVDSNDRLSQETTKPYFSPRFGNFPLSLSPYGPFAYEMCSYAPMQPGVYPQFGHMPVPVYPIHPSSPYPYVPPGYYAGIPPNIIERMPSRSKNYHLNSSDEKQ